MTGPGTTLFMSGKTTGLAPNFSANSEELLEANPYSEKEGFEPSFAAKWLRHWPVLHSPITAPESAFIKERV